MDDLVKLEMENAGFGVENALNRFLENEELYFSFLVEFTKDNLFEQMKEFVKEGNVKQALEAAHTLKGVSANLGIDAINEILNPIVDILRYEKLDNVQEEIDKLTLVYDNAIDTINTYCK